MGLTVEQIDDAVNNGREIDFSAMTDADKKEAHTVLLDLWRARGADYMDTTYADEAADQLARLKVAAIERMLNRAARLIGMRGDHDLGNAQSSNAERIF